MGIQPDLPNMDAEVEEVEDVENVEDAEEVTRNVITIAGLQLTQVDILPTADHVGVLKQVANEVYELIGTLSGMLMSDDTIFWLEQSTRMLKHVVDSSGSPLFIAQLFMSATNYLGNAAQSLN
jgi:hypothetical protein